MLLFCAVDVQAILIPNVGGHIIMYSKGHIDIFLLVSFYYFFDDKVQES